MSVGTTAAGARDAAGTRGRRGGRGAERKLGCARAQPRRGRGLDHHDDRAHPAVIDASRVAEAVNHHRQLGDHRVERLRHRCGPACRGVASGVTRGGREERAVSLLSALSTPRGSRSTAAVETNTGPGTAAAAVAYACSSPISARGRREPQKGCWRRAEGVAGAAVNWLLAHRLVLNLSDHIWHFHRPPARFRRRDTTNSPHRCIIPTSKKPGRRRRAHSRRIRKS